MTAKKPEPAPSTSPRPSGLSWISHPLAVGTVAARTWTEMGAEAVRFARDRLQQDIKTQHEMLGCTSLEELRKIHAAFLTAARDQYAAETNNVLGLMGQAAAEVLSASAAARRYDDVPL